MLKNDLVKLLGFTEFLISAIENEFWGDDYNKFNEYTFAEVERFGGEGCGDSYWVVFSIEKDGIKEFYKLNGWYASHYGYEFDSYTNFKKVEQKEKVIKVWE